jgi:hypothetical protein
MTTTPATLMPASLRAFTDAAADAVAGEIANFRREAERERDLYRAQYDARMAELSARLDSVTMLERSLAERLASIKDGEPGRDGVDGQNGNDGQPGRDGKDIEPEHISGIVAIEVERVLASWERPRDGTSVTLADVEPVIGEAVQRAVAALPAPRDGKDGVDGADGAPGHEGAPGKLGEVKGWEDRVYYQGEIVTLAGSTYQAVKDTGRAPPVDDWTLIAAGGTDGVDGRSFEIRGTWSEAAEYSALDVVMLNGASFVAKHDTPGICPGEGWQLMSMQGKTGKPGDRGAPGQKGDRGEPGQALVALDVSEEGILTAVNGDGSVVTCDLYPLLSRIGG